MPESPVSAVSLFLVGLHVAISIAAVILAQSHLVRLQSMLSGQTRKLVTTLARTPEPDRIAELQRKAPPKSIEWRIADEALQADPAFQSSAVDYLLADVALALEERSHWPKAAARIAGASGVFLMALDLALRLEVAVAVVLLVATILPVVACMSIDHRASALSTEFRRDIDALVDVLALRGPPEPERAKKIASNKHRRARRRG